ncbi:unnamed protein product [Nippostrongylus brasiliensis]|uniref:DCAF8 n=1 Tax=Nippostrongylus brasiliensis TaxID=27835 RepID=A0A0N4XJI8_NIPBR|nr:unnamed protein product [Nippostrongylus brasiliensis]
MQISEHSLLQSGSETSASEEEEEEERGDTDATMMEEPDDSDDVQILDENVEQPREPSQRSPSSHSDEQSSAVNLAKRRRTDNLTSEDGDIKPRYFLIKIKN